MENIFRNTKAHAMLFHAHYPLNSNNTSQAKLEVSPLCTSDHRVNADMVHIKYTTRALYVMLRSDSAVSLSHTHVYKINSYLRKKYLL